MAPSIRRRTCPRFPLLGWRANDYDLASSMETVGNGRGIAALFNARAKQFTPKAVRAMRAALPEALILVSEDLEQAKRQAARIIEAKPDVVLAAGGDGSIVRLVNLLRETGNGVLPTVGILKMCTG